ncbi:hypothetical protein FRC02_010209 [Tulasnella sp. 418]|nr:hypothetical protein FRC02_010209 [Tulasnella sp. 418]
MEYTPLSSIPKIRDELKRTFASGKTRSLEYRKQQLAQLAHMLKENAEDIRKALLEDLGKPYLESNLAELCVAGAAVNAISKLDDWVAPEFPKDVHPFHANWNMQLLKQPRGAVLIIGPWNYPLVLTLGILVGAIGAGCTAAIKLSELSPSFATLMTRIFPLYMDQSAFRIINGAVPEVTEVLKLQWDFIFYTGNANVGRIIATAAAKHLTPICLELGSKTPVIVDSTVDMKVTAKRVAWGKCQAAGQVCVSADYVVILREKQDEFVSAYKEALDSFYPEGASKSPSYSKIVNINHFRRLKSLLERQTGKIVVPGNVIESELMIEPIVMVDVKREDALFQDEIFGPLLPVVAVDSIDEAIAFVNDLPNPLTTHLFSNDEETKKKVAENTLSGRIVYNDTFSHLGVFELPFGGVGESGYGYQMGRYLFNNFVVQRGSMDIPFEQVQIPFESLKLSY